MIDKFGRNITYLRLSVTELCNLRCRYCMPADGVCKKSHTEMLTEDEMIDVVKAAASLGITKARITGGEPLVKKNIVSICERTANVDGIEEVCLTTNAVLLPQYAKPLRDAGVNRLNISLDTLNPEKYAYITRIGVLEDAMQGIQEALDAGFEKVKINAVLIGGFNEDEISSLAELTMQYPIDVRFIEMMPMYDSGDFDETGLVPCAKVLEVLPELQIVNASDGVAELYRLPNALGNVGLIRPISAHFCGTCNRIRVTADGKLKPCLHASTEYALKGLSFDDMKTVMAEAIYHKPQWHGELDTIHRSRAGRNMNEIGG
ncbi:MAG: GTP 3',8-cyclase MoaA [Peptococcaceae bacterium]|nr:GTP 3',8-cyclase MoaA [Peptococcaceae bacterium]